MGLGIPTTQDAKGTGLPFLAKRSAQFMGPALRLILHLGAREPTTSDLLTARALGVRVTNTPGVPSAAAEHKLALLGSGSELLRGVWTARPV